MKLREELLGRVHRIVVKLGTGLLTDERNQLSQERMETTVAQLAGWCEQKRQVLVVSSGAIAAGMAALGLKQRPKHLHELQACAAIGQSKLMAIYDALFAKRSVAVAQVLLTHDDLKQRDRHLNARNTLLELLARGVVPIINENDTVAVDEIKFGDNDRLGALTATLIDADVFVILSHVEGLLDRSQQLITTVPEITRDIEALAGGTDRVTSVGGMKSKIAAARIVTRAGIPMVIANRLTGLLDGDEIGTLFLPQGGKLASRKRWIAFFQKPAGIIVVDDGARSALCQSGKSLLAKGVVRTEGKFAVGEIVSIHDTAGNEFARGLVKATSGVMVHRDDLVIL
jgi:glutamate 5-kinase